MTDPHEDPPKDLAKDWRVRLLHKIMKDEKLSSGAKVVVVLLLTKFMNRDTRQCNPSVATLCTYTGRKRRTIFDALDELRAAGWLSKNMNSSGRSSFYEFQTPSSARSEADDVISARQPDAECSVCQRTPRFRNG